MKYLTIVMLVAAVLVAGCRKQSSKEQTSELDQAKAYAAAEVSIEQQRKLENTDWATIAETFKATLPIVQAIDKKHKTTYEADINAALEKCAKGEDVEVNQQVLAKGLQHITVLAINDQLEKMPFDGERQHASDMVEALFEGIRPTFTRRDLDFFADMPVLERTANETIQYLKSARGSDVIMAVQGIQSVIDRTYALCVYFEFTGIEEKRGTDAATCAKKMKEAELFYRIIAPTVKRNSKKNDELLSTMVTADFEKVDSKAAETALQEGLGRSANLK